LFDHLRKITGGPLVWAPGVDGALVVSLRGGDFLLEVGQDLAIGYHAHDADSVHLYLVESFSFRVATPEAAVALRPAERDQRSERLVRDPLAAADLVVRCARRLMYSRSLPAPQLTRPLPKWP
jgi:hypothetical protein